MKKINLLMKKFVLMLALIAGGITYDATAQVSLNVNIGSQPVWGPVGYDRVDYYYVPDIDAYYLCTKKAIYLPGRAELDFCTGPTR
jgi:hypothetical protein